MKQAPPAMSHLNKYYAKKYGIAEAFLINHFQYWIQFNAETGRNFREGKTWMYQSLQDIADHFGFYSMTQIKRAVVMLVRSKILRRGNFNKNGYDRTSWYCFVNEDEFGIPPSYTSQRSQMDNEKNLSASTALYKDINKKEEGEDPPPPSPQEDAARLNSATEISLFLFQKLKERNPDKRKPPTNKWAKEIDTMMRVDKLSQDKIMDLLEWAFHENNWWAGKIQSPRGLRKNFDKMMDQKLNPPKNQTEAWNKKMEETVIEENKKWIQPLKRVTFVYKKQIKITDESITIVNGEEYAGLSYNDPAFREIVSNQLRKWGMEKTIKQLNGRSQ